MALSESVNIRFDKPGFRQEYKLGVSKFWVATNEFKVCQYK
jgi:hypothetical protein